MTSSRSGLCSRPSRRSWSTWMKALSTSESLSTLCCKARAKSWDSRTVISAGSTISISTLNLKGSSRTGYQNSAIFESRLNSPAAEIISSGAIDKNVVVVATRQTFNEFDELRRRCVPDHLQQGMQREHTSISNCNQHTKMSDNIQVTYLFNLLSNNSKPSYHDDN